jgi:hypothetical protein
MSSPSRIPDGNDILKEAMPAIVGLIEQTAQWVNPETFHRLPVWAPYTARGQPEYNAQWTIVNKIKRKKSGQVIDATETNIRAQEALLKALGVANPKPKNWTVCHIWGYDDPSFADHGSITHEIPPYRECG